MTVAIVVLASIAVTLAAVVLLSMRANRRGADVPLASRAEQPLLERPCPRCGARLGTHEAVCGACRSSVPARALLCPKCGLHVGALTRFCKRCHTRIGG